MKAGVSSGGWVPSGRYLSGGRWVKALPGDVLEARRWLSRVERLAASRIRGSLGELAVKALGPQQVTFEVEIDLSQDCGVPGGRMVVASLLLVGCGRVQLGVRGFAN